MNASALMKNIKSETVLSFLKAKGWTEAKQVSWYISMKPASEIKTDDDTYLYIPQADYEGTNQYAEVMHIILNSIAGIYELDVQDLESLFSKTLEEIKQSVARQQAMLAAAS